MNVKDAIIALLVFYVVADLLLIWKSNGGHLGLIGGLQSAMRSEDAYVVLIIAGIAAAIAYTLSMKIREHFTMLPNSEPMIPQYRTDMSQ